MMMMDIYNQSSTEVVKINSNLITVEITVLTRFLIKFPMAVPWRHLGCRCPRMRRLAHAATSVLSSHVVER